MESLLEFAIAFKPVHSCCFLSSNMHHIFTIDKVCNHNPGINADSNDFYLYFV